MDQEIKQNDEFVEEKNEELQENSQLEKIQSKLDNLTELFNEKIKFDEHKNAMFDNMHKELTDYRNDVNQKNIDTMALDIIQLLDIYSKIINKAEENECSEENYKKLLNNFNGILQDLLDILYRQNIEPYESDDEIVDVKRQKIISTIFTDDESLNNKIATKNALGYEKNGKIIRPERITIYKYKKGE